MKAIKTALKSLHYKLNKLADSVFFFIYIVLTGGMKLVGIVYVFYSPIVYTYMTLVLGEEFPSLLLIVRNTLIGLTLYYLGSAGDRFENKKVESS